MYSALALMALLISTGTVITINAAHAEEPTFVAAENKIKVVYKGGAVQVISDFAEFNKLELTSGTKEIDYFDFTTLVTSDQAFTLKTITGLKPSITVLNAKGEYVSVSQSGANYAISRYLGAPNMWQVYNLKVTAKTIDSLIGQRTNDFNSNVRFATHTSDSLLTISTDKGNYGTAWAIATANFKALKSGIISEPTPGGTASGDKPTGRVFHTVSITLTDGSGRTLIDSAEGQLSTFDLSVIGQGEPIKSIKYSLWLHLDRDVYAPSNSLLFDNLASTSNYGVYVDGKGIANEHTNVIKRFSAVDSYRLLEIEVLGSDIEPLIDTEVGNDGNVVYKSGEIEFFAKPSFVKLSSPSNTYTINIPEQSLKYNLLSATLISTTDDDTPCEIVDGENCEQDTTDRANLVRDALFITAIGIGTAGLVSGVVIVTRKK